MAGLFGLIGAAGALIAPAAGKITDRKTPRSTVGLGIYVTIASYLCFWWLGGTLAGLIAGVVLLDVGVQSGHVANQTRIYSLIPEARGRLNMVYMVTILCWRRARLRARCVRLERSSLEWRLPSRLMSGISRARRSASGYAHH